MNCEHKKPTMTIVRREDYEFEWDGESWVVDEPPKAEGVVEVSYWCGDCGEKIEAPDPWHWS